MKVKIRRASESRSSARHLDDVPLAQVSQVLAWVRDLGLAGDDAACPMYGEIVLSRPGGLALEPSAAYFEVVVCDTSSSAETAQDRAAPCYQEMPVR